MTTHSIQFGKRKQTPHSMRIAPARPHHSGGKPTGPQAAQERHQNLVSQTEKWVSQTFYGQLMKQMRDSPFKSKMFSGGRGGEAFGQMFDQKIADRISKGAGGKLVTSIVKKLESGKAYSNTSIPRANLRSHLDRISSSFQGVA